MVPLTLPLVLSFSLIKMVFAIAAKSEQKPTWNQLEHAIRRNFGGLEEGKPVGIFKQYFQVTEVSRTNPDVRVKDT